MKTALKVNRKQLFELYEKSCPEVKKNLRTELGETFFTTDAVKPEAVKVPKPKTRSNKAWRIDWEMLFDFTPVLRIAVYGFLIGIILLSI